MPLVDLKSAPYHLDDGQIAWVEQTLASMTLEEQVGQLFTNLFFFGPDSFSGNAYTAEDIIQKFHIGCARYQGGTAAEVQDLLNRLQGASRIPCSSQPTATPAATAPRPTAPTSPPAPRPRPAAPRKWRTTPATSPAARWRRWASP